MPSMALMSEGAKVRVMVPYALREYTRGREAVELRAPTLAAAVAALEAQFPGIGYRLLDDQGRMRRYVVVLVNEDPVADFDPAAVALRDGDTVHLLPSTAGG
jgi:molybdopterin converting factor small subunit